LSHHFPRNRRLLPSDPWVFKSGCSFRFLSHSPLELVLEVIETHLTDPMVIVFCRVADLHIFWVVRQGKLDAAELAVIVIPARILLEISISTMDKHNPFVRKTVQ